MTLATIGRILIGLLLIPVAAAAGYVAAGLLTSGGDDGLPLIEFRDHVIPGEKNLKIPAINGNQTIRGIVQKGNGQPIAGAKVRIAAGFIHSEITTNEFGRFVMESLPEGPVSVIAAQTGYRPDLYTSPSVPSREIIMKLDANDEFHTKNPSAGWQSGTVTVEVVPEPGRETPPKLTIAAFPTGGDARDSALLPRLVNINTAEKTTTTASVKIESLPTGDYQIFAIPHGKSPDARRAIASGTAHVEFNKSAHVRLQLATGTVKGVVTADDKEVANALVRIYRKAGADQNSKFVVTNEVEVARVATESDGTFIAAGLPLGEVQVEILVSGFAAWSKPVLTDPNAQTIRVELTPAK
ncbi:MAG: carboxypeptidase regulatory-like domain-containing protein [Planctomycetota bacterium]